MSQAAYNSLVKEANGVIDYSWWDKSPFFKDAIRYFENMKGLRWDKTNVNRRILSAPPVWQDIRYNKDKKFETRFDATFGTIRQRCGCVKDSNGISIHCCAMHWEKKTRG